MRFLALELDGRNRLDLAQQGIHGVVIGPAARQARLWAVRRAMPADPQRGRLRRWLRSTFSTLRGARPH